MGLLFVVKELINSCKRCPKDEDRTLGVLPPYKMTSWNNILAGIDEWKQHVSGCQPIAEKVYYFEQSTTLPVC